MSPSVGIVHGRLRPSHVLPVERRTQWVSVSASFNRQPPPTARTRMVEPFSSADCTPATMRRRSGINAELMLWAC